ncbi:MAG: S41 family peptidase [Proteobacteria bacterium]|nr:S41 family peptidase [Pseudomonadota bacterium]MBU1714605.1 S41 family peptidase [Pseudomonadota bacterium]
MKKKIASAKIIMLAVVITVPILSLILWGNNTGVAAKTQDTYKSLEIFSNVLSIIQKNYVENVETTEVLQGAIKGMLASLDPHSSYMKPDDFKELKLETKGSFTGIGIEITTKDSILTVVSPIEGTPGFNKGLKAGDKIIKIEDEPTKDMSLMEAVKKLRGEKGTEVTISIHREGWTQLKRITIVRDVIPLHSVKSRLLEPGYAYIRITNFQSKTTNDFISALEELAKIGPIKGLIMDLRNNPGGLLAQSVKLADVFIDEGVIVSTKGRVTEQNTVYEARKDDTPHNFPIAILVNEGSASASEIVAGALQDHNKALIVGVQTFGKGSVQTIIPMSNGAGLRLTTARYYTPKGISIQAKGITPDIYVENHPIADTPEENGDNEPRFLREKDLKQHLTNGNAPKKEDKEIKDTLIEEDTPDDKESDEEKALKIKKELERDQQLNTGLMLLKGLNVFNSFSNDKTAKK